jgi:peroxiredoxin
MTLDVRQAPDIHLLDAQGRRVSLRRWRGRPLVLVFLRWLG